MGAIAGDGLDLVTSACKSRPRMKRVLPLIPALALFAAADTPLRPGNWHVHSEAVAGAINGEPLSPERLKIFGIDAVNCLTPDAALDPIAALGARICAGQIVRRERGHASVTGNCPDGESTEIEVTFTPTHFEGTLTSHGMTSGGPSDLTMRLIGDRRGNCPAVPKPQKRPKPPKSTQPHRQSKPLKPAKPAASAPLDQRR
ncbi:MAG: DUF3617 domain-containing protein [Sphingomonas sp.]|nr:DUF3617 domain-containing protein [Sphingomonas sp.]